MSDRPFEIVQKVYNAVDTAESAWTAYKDSCIPEYDIAYELHGTALRQSRLNITNREEQGWKVLSLILGSALGAWVPKIPIMNRIFALGVDVAFYHPGRRSATIGGTWIRPGYVLDMVRMIDWATRRSAAAAEANTCRLPRRYVLEVPQTLLL